MIDSKFIPENVRRLMSPEAQKHYGLSTNEETEKEMQVRFDKWCREQRLAGLQRLRSRMDKATTVQRGTFDFLLWVGPKLAWVEFKTERGRLTNAQSGFLDEQVRNGTPAMVARSVEDAQDFVRKHLLL